MRVIIVLPPVGVSPISPTGYDVVEEATGMCVRPSKRLCEGQLVPPAERRAIVKVGVQSDAD
jgi:hypothetical protein